jgi:hypothetical protein
VRIEDGSTPFIRVTTEDDGELRESVEVILINHQILKLDNRLALKYAQLPPGQDVAEPHEFKRKLKIITPRIHPVRMLRGKYKPDSKREAPLGAFQVTAYRLKNGLALLNTRNYDIATQTVETPHGEGLLVRVESSLPILDPKKVSGHHMREIMQEFNSHKSGIGNQSATVFEE